VPHFVDPAAQNVLHFPAEHTWFSGHTLPHIPQLRMSASRSTQDAPHFVVPPTQSALQNPAEQT
jgi:hypothetical protein